MDEPGRAELAAVVSAAQRVAGVAAARTRGDHRGAHDLLTSFDDSDELAGGALLAAELLVRMLADERNVHVDRVAQELCADLEAALDQRV